MLKTIPSSSNQPNNSLITLFSHAVGAMSDFFESEAEVSEDEEGVKASSDEEEEEGEWMDLV